MLTLFQFAPINGETSPSPFCHKVEVYCRLANIAYCPRPALPRSAPLQKLPYIIDHGQVIPDSIQIIDYLEATYNNPLDHELTPAQRAQGHLIRTICEQSLYFTFIYSRWCDEAHWPETKRLFFSKLPSILRPFISNAARKKVKQTLYIQGYGRLPEKIIYTRGETDLVSLAQILAQTPFAAGMDLSSFDATLYAFLHAIIRYPSAFPLKQIATSYPSCQDYLKRMDAILAAHPPMTKVEGAQYIKTDYTKLA